MPARLRRSSTRIADVGQDQVDAGQMLLAARTTRRNRRSSQLRRALVAEPVERQVHADLADAAERREDEFVAAAIMPCLPAAARNHVARGDRSALPPSAQPQHQAGPLSSRVSKLPAQLALGQCAPDRLAEARGAREPVGADRGEARAAVPLREPRRPSRAVSAANRRLRRRRGRPPRRDRSPGYARPGRMMRRS